MGAGDAAAYVLQDGDERLRFVLLAVVGVKDLRMRVIEERVPLAPRLVVCADRLLQTRSLFRKL
jgi:hypothetical protein